ncbi:MAG: glycosyltransferase family 4 protein [Ferruginibacter sp.]
MNKKNTLVILTPGFPSSEADSTCLPMQQSFVRTLKDDHPELNIIILSFQYPYLKKVYQWHDITVMSFNGQNKGNLKRLLLRRTLYSTLKNICGSYKIAGILSFWYGECALVGKRFAGKHDIKHFCWVLGQDAKKENNYPQRVRVKAAQLIVLSDFLQDEFEKNHNTRPMHVIPFGTDPRQFSPASTEKNIDILGVGSLIALKQYDIFIEVVAAIKRSLPAVKAMLVGNGPEKEKLQTLISEYGLEDNITLTGELPYDNVLQLMQRTKLLLHPSYYEGFSGVCLEALSAGAEVISFCRAMKQEIEYWHIVEGIEEMKQKTLFILQNKKTVSASLPPFLMSNTVKAIVQLFN